MKMMIAAFFGILIGILLDVLLERAWTPHNDTTPEGRMLMFAVFGGIVGAVAGLDNEKK